MHEYGWGKAYRSKGGLVDISEDNIFEERVTYPDTVDCIFWTESTDSKDMLWYHSRLYCSILSEVTTSPGFALTMLSYKELTKISSVKFY